MATKKISKKASGLADVNYMPSPAARSAPGLAMHDKAAARKAMKDEMRYKAEDALSTLERAEKHRQDKGLMRHVSKLAAEKAGRMVKIAKGSR